LRPPDDEFLIYSGYKDNAVEELVDYVEGGGRFRFWNTKNAPGYGYVERYCRQRNLVAVVATTGFVLVDTRSNQLWQKYQTSIPPFEHTCVAFTPSGEWLLVLGDETLYALTLDDHVLRRVIKAPGVVALAGHRDGVLLLAADNVTLLETAMLVLDVKVAEMGRAQTAVVTKVEAALLALKDAIEELHELHEKSKK